jgi:hypothetical protein
MGSSIRQVHPVDKLDQGQKCRIYYSRVVDLAVARGLLTSDQDSDIGYFAFSAYYREGAGLDTRLGKDISVYESLYPDLAFQRKIELNREFLGVVSGFLSEDNEEKINDLIIIGATHCVWPTGTSFVLTYPWDLAGHGQPVRFKKDLSDFTKRRIIDLLKRAGKLWNRNLFDE